MLRLFFLAVLLLAAAGGAAYWTLARDDGAEADVEVVRWGNITVSVSEGSGVSVARYIALPEENPPDGGLVVRLIRGDSQTLIDADDGRIVRQQIADSDRTQLEAVIATLTLEEPPKADLLPWPYGKVPPSKPKMQMGSLRFWPPDPAAGITLYPSYEDSPDQPGLHLVITNGRSRRGIYGGTGEVVTSSDRVVPEDADAFERWTQAVEFVGPSR